MVNEEKRLRDKEHTPRNPKMDSVGVLGGRSKRMRHRNFRDDGWKFQTSVHMFKKFNKLQAR